jgi:hypothetical protein
MVDASRGMLTSLVPKTVRSVPKLRTFGNRLDGCCDNPPRKIPYYRLNQATLVIKR